MLKCHDLDAHLAALLKEELRLDDMADVTLDELKEMGVPLGPRKRIVKLWSADGGAAAITAAAAAMGGGAGAAAAAEPLVAGGAAAAAVAPPGIGDLDKFIAPGKTLHLGSILDATLGIGNLLLGDGAEEQMAQYTLEGEAAIEREFMQNGSATDRSNYVKVRDGTYGDGKTLEALMAHASTKVAKLQRYHVLGLRLYTTSSYRAINVPLRTVPVTRPNPFAATTFFISEAIKKMRTIEAKTVAGMAPRTLWRGVHGLALTKDFMTKGGTEFACMSTSASPDIAANFAKTGQNPMIFKYDTKNCIERGADVAYLSVYEGEAEVLYPPLTYLQFNGVQEEEVAGTKLLVVSVEAQIVGN